jgi:hypothetical protein
MSGNEKSEQIGDAMQLLEQQKQELAHLVAKTDKVKLAYRKFASESVRWRVDRVNRDRVILEHPSTEERDLASHLLAQPELAKLVVEKEEAEEALRQTKAKLAGFGITSV